MIFLKGFAGALQRCRLSIGQKDQTVNTFSRGRQIFQVPSVSPYLAAPPNISRLSVPRGISSRSLCAGLAIAEIVPEGRSWRERAKYPQTSCISDHIRQLSGLVSEPRAQKELGVNSAPAGEPLPPIVSPPATSQPGVFAQLAGQLRPSDGPVVVNAKLQLVHGTVHAGSLVNLIRHSNLSTSLLLKVSEWAFSQPSWCHDVRVFTRLVQHAGQRGDKQGLVETIELARRSDCPLDRFFFSSATVQLNVSNLHSESVRLLDLSERYGVKANAADSMQQLIALKRMRDLKRAKEVVAKLQVEGGEGPKECHYCVLMDLCGLTRNRVELLRVFEEMDAVDMEKTVESYTSYIQACGLLGEADAALGMWEEMQRKSTKPNAVTYGILHGVLMMARRPREAGTILAKALKDTTLVRDGSYYRLLITSCLYPVDADKLLTTVREMHSLGFASKSKAWTNILFTLAYAKEVQACLSLVSEIESRGQVQLSQQAYIMLARVLRNKEMWEECAMMERKASGVAGEVANVPKQINLAEKLLYKRQFKDLAKLIRDTEGRAPNSLYFMIMRSLEYCGAVKNTTTQELMVALRACKHPLHEIVELLSSKSIAEDKVWSRTCEALDNAWKGGKHEPWRFLDALLSLLVAQGLHGRAARLWEETKGRDLMVPYVKPLQLVKGVWEIDVHETSLQCAKLVVCCELQHVSKMTEHEELAIITGVGNRSRQSTCVLRDGVLALLHRMKGPFEVSSRNDGRLVANVGLVRDWLRVEGVQNNLVRCGN